MPERRVGKGIGHFFGALNIEGFIELEAFKRQIDDWIRTFRQTAPAPGTEGPLIPGDPERRAEVARATEGVPVLVQVVESLRRISSETGVPLD
jgi:LDH2 family malate/lactate/ureidoglycolate dehydrogenase